MTFSSSYTATGMPELLTFLVRSVSPIYTFEIGTQQGGSATIISNAMSAGSRLWTCDLFEPQYRAPPHGDTHASFELAKSNLAQLNNPVRVSVLQSTYQDAVHWLTEEGWSNSMDLLHIDICNHYDNLKPIMQDIVLQEMFGKPKMIILEGGVHNKWQRDCGFSSFVPLLDEPWMSVYNHQVIPFNDHNAVTVLWRASCR